MDPEPGPNPGPTPPVDQTVSTDPNTGALPEDHILSPGLNTGVQAAGHGPDLRCPVPQDPGPALHQDLLQGVPHQDREEKKADPNLFLK